MNNDQLTRRHLLGWCTTSTVPLVAGCSNGGDEGKSTPDSTTQSETNATTTTETVVFTDATTSTEEPTTTDMESEATVFDGGTLQAFLQAVKSASERDPGRVKVEPGTYEFNPMTGPESPDSYHGGLVGISGVTIEGSGATFVFTNPLKGGLRFADSEDITLRNLTIDYDPVPFTQGTITGVGDDRQQFTVSLDAGFPSLTHNMFDQSQDVWASVHQPDGAFVEGLQATGVPRKLFADISKIGEQTFELTLDRGVSTVGLETENRVTIVARNHKTAVTFGAVMNATVENVSVRASGGSAFSFPFTHNPTVRNCYIGPPDNSDRQIGTDGDGIRIVNASGRARVEGCRTESLLDDAIVVQQVLGRVDEVVNSRTVRLRDAQAFQPEAGDQLQGMAPTGHHRAQLPIVGSVDESRKSGTEIVRIEFEGTIEGVLSSDDLLRNTANAPDEFVVRDNELRNNRGKQIRIAASHGVVEGNRMVGGSANGIELETDTDGIFVPKGWVEDVTVRNNTIRETGLSFFTGDHPAAVRVHHLPRPGITSTGRPNRDLTIRDNDIRHCASSGIEVEAALNVEIRNNTLRDLNHRPDPPGDYGMAFSMSTDLTVNRNTVAGPSDRLDGFGWQKASSGLALSENQLMIDGETVSIDIPEWVPVKFEFNRALAPGNSSRQLSFRCYKLKLREPDGSSIKQVNVGNADGSVLFGRGVFDANSNEKSSWRWFGTPEATAVVFFKRSFLEAATSLEIYGQAIDNGMSMTASVSGEQTASINLGERRETWYTLSL